MQAMRISAGILGLLMAGCAPPSAWNMPPIIGASRDGDTERIRAAIEAGADVNVRAGVNGWTPLMHAIHKGQAGSVRVLLKLGADPNARGGGGSTPLIMAAGYGNVETVRLLLEGGANPRLKASDGGDALAAAVSGVPDIDRFTVGHCQTDTVRALLAADPGLPVPTGAPAGVARLAGCREVIELLARGGNQDGAK